MQMMISEEITLINRAFVEGLARILGEKLYGAYIYGATAFPDAVPTNDIDFHVILTSVLTDSERLELEALHESLGRQFPRLGGELDGYYILLEDARRTSPPQSQMWSCAIDTSWALHREHIRAGRHIVLYGPDPREIYPSATWSELEYALRVELEYVETHLLDYPDYCILNLCRLLYSFETRDVVVSKARASEWAYVALPEWRPCIDLARKSYAKQATSSDREFILSAVQRFAKFAEARIERSFRKAQVSK
jgi:hypothetical protein